MNKINIFNIPTYYNFLEALYCWLEENFFNQSQSLSQENAPIIILPSNLAVKEFKKIIAKKEAKRVTKILPRIIAVGELSYQNIFEIFNRDNNGEELIERAIELINHKKLEDPEFLMFLIAEVIANPIFSKLNSYQLAVISSNIAEIFNEIMLEEIDLSTIKAMEYDSLPKHRQEMLDFLCSIEARIKNSAIKQKILSNQLYQQLIFENFIDLLNKNQLQKPLIIAGSTGSLKIGRKLIKAISSQNKGYVILQGANIEELESFVEDKKSGQFNSQTHPQFFIKKLIDFLEILPKDIVNIRIDKLEDDNFFKNKLWSQFVDVAISNADNCHKFSNLNNIFNQQQSLAIIEMAKEKVGFIFTENIIEEAVLIAKTLAKKYSDADSSEQNTAIIINDDNFRDFLKLELSRVGLPYLDECNISIADCRFIQLINLIAKLVNNNFSSIELLSILKHSIILDNIENIEMWQDLTAQFEINFIRKARDFNNYQGLKKTIECSLNQEIKLFAIKIISSFDNLLDLQKNWQLEYLIIEIGKIIESIISIGRSDNSIISFSQIINQQPEKKELKKLFNNLMKKSQIRLRIGDLARFIKIIAGKISYFEVSQETEHYFKNYKINPIKLISTIDARLLNHDLLVLTSLSEGVFPQISSDNWLGKKLQAELGIDKRFSSIGRNQYDFRNYLNNQKILLTASKFIINQELRPSQLLTKIELILSKLSNQKADIINFTNLHFHQQKYRNFESGSFIINDSDLLLQAKIIKNSQQNLIKVAKNLIPRKLSVTDIENISNDSYYFYVTKILQIKPLLKIDEIEGKREFGSLIHAVLEEIVKTNFKNSEKSMIINFANSFFDKYADKYLVSYYARMQYYQDFIKYVSIFIEYNSQYLGNNYENYAEYKVESKIGDINISGKIDRIIINISEQKIKIIDYKTGQQPWQKDVLALKKPQLIILAILLDNYENLVKNNEINAIAYWRWEKILIKETAIKNVFYLQNKKKEEDFTDKRIELISFIEGITANDEFNIRKIAVNKNDFNSEYCHLLRLENK